MFDTGGIAGMLAKAAALLAEAAASITRDTTGPAAQEAMGEAIAAGTQMDLTLCLLSERMNRSGAYPAENVVSMGTWLRNEARSSTQWSSTRITVGRALVDTLPATRTAMGAGKLTLEHAVIINRAVADLDSVDDAGIITALDTALAEAAATVGPRDLQRIATALLEELVPDKQDANRERKAAHRQKLHLSDTPDGGRLDADLDAEGTAILRAALDKYMPKLEPVMHPDATPGNPLLLSQRRAIALVEIARQALDFGTGHAGSANKPHLVLTMTAQHLRDSYGTATTTDGSILPISVVRRLACDAKIIPLVIGSDSLPRHRTHHPRHPPTHQSRPQPPRQRLRHPRLRPAPRLVRRPPRRALAQRRNHRPHQPRPALPKTPHPQPPRQTPHQSPRQPAIHLHQHEPANVSGSNVYYSVMNGIDLTDLDAFAGGFPHAIFARHRSEAPVYWHGPTAHTPDGEGFWSVATYSETRQVLRDPVTFSSERYWSGKPRPTATRRPSKTRQASTYVAAQTRIWRSAAACISARARTWPA